MSYGSSLLVIFSMQRDLSCRPLGSDIFTTLMIVTCNIFLSRAPDSHFLSHFYIILSRFMVTGMRKLLYGKWMLRWWNSFSLALSNIFISRMHTTYLFWIPKMTLKKPDMDTGEDLLFVSSYYYTTDEEYTRLIKGFCRRGFSDSEISYLKEVGLGPQILFMLRKQLRYKQSSQKRDNVVESDLLVIFAANCL